MKKTTIFVIFFFAAFVSAASAQPMMRAKGSGGWGPASQYSRMYDPKTVETVSGVVEKVERMRPGKGISYGIHLIVRTDKDNLDVHLGPGWFIEKQDVAIATGDKVEITGSRIKFQERPVIIAAKVRKGDEILTLRDEKGFPAWAGWRKK